MGVKRSGRHRTPASAPCPQCGRAFARNDSLIRHMKTHTSHVEERPFHRIINDKFRACDHCRSSKIRCTGNIPCTRCEQLKKECSYGHKKVEPASDRLSPTPVPSAKPPTEEPNEGRSRSVSSSATTRQDGQSLNSPVQADREPVSADDTHQDTQARQGLSVSSPQSIRSLLQLSDVYAEDNHALPFMISKDHLLSSSTYVSPTFHVLDPYSYKLPSIADSREPLTPSAQPLAHCQYPVLQYLAPFIDVDFSSKLACDLVDTFFSSAYSSRMHPTCHHIHNFILRRCDIVDPIQPRTSHPALLASMLFVAALSDRALGLFSGPEERDRVCKYLSLVTFRLLNPSRYEPLLSQEDLGLPPTLGSTPGWTNDDLRRALVSQQQSETFPINWPTDYIIALIHVSSVISGSEKKAASIRWWNVAFNLARDLKLNQEVESYTLHDDSIHGRPTFNCQCTIHPESEKDIISEVHREERRRTWWLLFLMDRHLALCYNRTLALLEAECKDLLLPLDDVTWQNSKLQPHSHGIRANGPRCMLLPMGVGRAHGPPLTCSGPGLFEFFLPLMTTTGHLLDYNRAKNNPVLASTGSSMWTFQERQILRQLDLYQSSLDQLPSTFSLVQGNEPGKDLIWSTSPAETADDSEEAHIIRTVTGYAKHVVCVLRILVGSKWDPVWLFEDSDFWTSSSGFKDSMSHTMAASECVTQILEEDPDISFMPYFFGIQLLHGSLLLLLVAYRLQADSGASILTAGEAVIRATEACFVTLPTDYQRQFRNVMRSAIGLARGRKSNPADTEKQLTFVLARYRWSRNGAGLAR